MTDLVFQIAMHGCIPGSVSPVQLRLFCLLGLLLSSFPLADLVRAEGMFHTMERPRSPASWAGGLEIFLSTVLSFVSIFVWESVILCSVLFLSLYCLFFKAFDDLLF